MSRLCYTSWHVNCFNYCVTLYKRFPHYEFAIDRFDCLFKSGGGMIVSAKTLTSRLNELCGQSNTVGMAVAAQRGGECVFSHNYGLQDKEKGIPVTDDTIFRIASSTKHISASVLMTLVDAGAADLDEDIGSYLGYRVRNPYYPDTSITLRHLMTHTSTFLESGNYNKICAGVLPPYKLSEVLQQDSPGYTLENYLQAKPGERYVYSSFGTGIMGCVAECITKQRFADLAKEIIFDPLGLDAAYDPDLLSDASKIAVSYEILKANTVDVTQPIEESEAKQERQMWLQKSLKNKKKLYSLPVGEAYRIAQGNVHIRAKDLLTVQSIFLQNGAAKGVRILSPQAVKEMLSVQFRDERVVSGLNLLHLDRLLPGEKFIGHFGRAYGAFSCTIFQPETNQGVIVLCNGTSPDLNENGHNKAIVDVFHAVFAELVAL